VIVSAEALAADAAFRFSVSDAGPGIPAEELPQIFDRFVKSADSGGSGLGLAISKRLVEAHGGRISASSDPDHGTTISFTLPRSPGPGIGGDLG
jgi:signal transduction histidine kinase